MQRNKKKTRSKSGPAGPAALFGANLRKIRTRNGLSIVKLAVKAKVSHTYLGKVERGEAAASVDFIGKITGALGVHAAEFFPSDEGEKGSLNKLRSELKEVFQEALLKATKAELEMLAVLLNSLNSAFSRNR